MLNEKKACDTAGNIWSLNAKTCITKIDDVDEYQEAAAIIINTAGAIHNALNDNTLEGFDTEPQDLIDAWRAAIAQLDSLNSAADVDNLELLANAYKNLAATYWVDIVWTHKSTNYEVVVEFFNLADDLDDNRDDLNALFWETTWDFADANAIYGRIITDFVDGKGWNIGATDYNEYITKAKALLAGMCNTWNHYDYEGKKCISNTETQPITNWQMTRTWANWVWGAWVYTCNTWYKVSGTTCVLDTWWSSSWWNSSWWNSSWGSSSGWWSSSWWGWWGGWGWGGWWTIYWWDSSTTQTSTTSGTATKVYDTPYNNTTKIDENMSFVGTDLAKVVEKLQEQWEAEYSEFESLMGSSHINPLWQKYLHWYEQLMEWLQTLDNALNEVRNWKKPSADRETLLAAVNQYQNWLLLMAEAKVELIKAVWEHYNWFETIKIWKETALKLKVFDLTNPAWMVLENKIDEMYKWKLNEKNLLQVISTRNKLMLVIEKILQETTQEWKMSYVNELKTALADFLSAIKIK